ncbi:unnamed protein product [Adineta steineri]|uniref:TIR domain-containing protein n=1 Tax=Adineta steineri TaxID=433720 RepID=A0A819W4E1_9BILA|nr:unnamed protein product [Adineta steineri]
MTLTDGKHVMLSYNWKSQKIVSRVYDILKDKDIPVWFDVQGGMKDDIYMSMAEGVENAAVVCCFMTPEYQESENCRLELTYAERQRKRIIACIIAEKKDWRPPPYYGDINTYDPQSTTFEFYGNFSFSVVSDNTTDVFCFEPGPVAVMNNTYSTIFMPLQCHAEISRLLLLKYDLQKKTYAQSSWYLKTGTFYYLYYDSHRQRLFEVIQEYTRQNGTQYGFASQGCSVFNPDENWIVEIRIVSAGQHYDAYYMKMDLNLVGKKQDIVTEFQKLPEFVEPYTMTYDMKTKLVLVTWKHGTIFTDTMMIYINPYTGKLHNEASLLKTPFGWFVQSVQALFDESTRQILFLIQQSDLQQIQITVWAITVEFDTMKIIEKKQVNALAVLQTWTFFKTEKKSNS